MLERTFTFSDFGGLFCAIAISCLTVVSYKLPSRLHQVKSRNSLFQKENVISHRQDGCGIFNLRTKLDACRTQEGGSGTNKSAQEFTRRDRSNCRFMYLCCICICPSPETVPSCTYAVSASALLQKLSLHVLMLPLPFSRNRLR